MRYTLLIALFALSLSASAQFWKKKKVEPIVRYDPIEQPMPDLLVNVSNASYAMPDVVPVNLKRNIYDIVHEEDLVMKDAKHHMRFRMYFEASYDFSTLAELYMLQNRFSEAKWYLLQSNAISREQKDDKHTVSNLIDLAFIKLAIGEPNLAKTDLKEAHDIATLNNFSSDLVTIDKKLQEMQSGKPMGIKAGLRYAEAVELKMAAKLHNSSN
jgi:hypothetical protein